MAITSTQLKSWGKIAIKLGVASTVATIIVKFLNLGFPLPAAIVPLLVLGQTRGTTVQSSLTRIKGTAIGIIVGVIVHITLGYAGLGSSTLALFVALATTVFLCHWVGLPGIKGSAGYIAAITMIFSSQGEPLEFAGKQFVALSIGIVVTMLVDEWLWPPRATKTLRHEASQMLSNLGKLYQLVFEGYTTGTYRGAAIADINNNIVGSIRRSELLWQDVVSENPQALWFASTWESLIHRIWDQVKAMDQVALTGYETDTIWKEMNPELNQLAEASYQGFRQLAEVSLRKYTEPDLPMLNLDPELSAAITKFEQVQTQIHHYPLVEQRRFYSFFYNMEEIAIHLKQISGVLWR